MSLLAFSSSGRHSRANGNRNAKEGPIYCFKIPTYVGRTQVGWGIRTNKDRIDILTGADASVGFMIKV